MEVFISADKNDIKSRFLELLCGYMKITERKLGKVFKVTKSSQEILKITNTPLLVTPKLNEHLTSDEITIAKQICDESGFLPLLFGNSKEQQDKITKYLNHIINDLKYEHKPLMQELNTALLYEMFIEGFINVTICDLMAYAVIACHLNQLSDEEKEQYCNVMRWADHIQNLKCVKPIAKEMKIWFSLPVEQFDLNTKGKGKKEKGGDHRPEGKEKKEKGGDNRPEGKEKKDKKEKKPQQQQKNKEKKDNKETKEGDNKPKDNNEDTAKKTEEQS